MNDSTGKEDFGLSREVTRNTLDFFFFSFSTLVCLLKILIFISNNKTKGTKQYRYLRRHRM